MTGGGPETAWGWAFLPARSWDIFIAYAPVKTHQIISSDYSEFVVCQLYLDKTVLKRDPSPPAHPRATLLS